MEAVELMAHSPIEPLYERLGHAFRDPELLREALTHPSHEGSRHYQRLEFLGDRVLGLIVAELLFEMFPSLGEGELATRFNLLVRRETLAEIAAELGFPDHLSLARGEAASGGRQKPAILADACEAVIAALYLDAGIGAARNFVRRVWTPRVHELPERLKDAKTALQEWLQAKGYAPPIYAEIGREGPAHEPLFTIEAAAENGASATGHGLSKRIAEQEAAAALLVKLGAREADGDR